MCESKAVQASKQSCRHTLDGPTPQMFIMRVMATRRGSVSRPSTREIWPVSRNSRIICRAEGPIFFTAFSFSHRNGSLAISKFKCRTRPAMRLNWRAFHRSKRCNGAPLYNLDSFSNALDNSRFLFVHPHTHKKTG